MVMEEEIKPTEELKITEAKEWVARSKQTHLVTLSSGIVVKLRKLRLLEHALNGSLPIPMFYKSLKTAQSLTDFEAWKDIAQDDLSGLLVLVRKIAVAVVVEPKVSEEENIPDTMYVGDIPEEDLFDIFKDAMGGQQTPLESFR